MANKYTEWKNEWSEITSRGHNYRPNLNRENPTGMTIKYIFGSKTSSKQYKTNKNLFFKKP